MRKISSAFLACLLLALLSLGGCSSSKPKADIPMATTQQMPVAPLAQSLPEYRMQVGDVVQISLLLNPELSEEATVRPDGMISTAVAQNVPAYGKTTTELRQSLIQEYRRHLTEPELTVVIKEFSPTRVYVLGEVNSPGEMVSVGPNMTLLQAISRAGGLKNSGDEDNIMIIRRGASEEPQVYRADYAAATSGMMPGQDIRLAAYDVVFVPRTGVADVHKHFQQNFQQFMPGIGLGGIL